MANSRIFFVTDLHGSDRCFRKLLNAADAYKAKILICGGDLTGKQIIPIMEQDGKYFARFLGEELTLTSQTELDTLVNRIRVVGYYPYITGADEVNQIRNDPQKMEEIFKKLIMESVAEWVRLAEERLQNTDVQLYIQPGNDDHYDIDPILNESEYIINPNAKIVQINPNHEMISLGYSNITPWNCPRDIPEEELAVKIEELASQVSNMKSAIFNIHVPPYGSLIDEAPKLDETLKPQLLPGGEPEMVPTGSTAVRTTIETHQPLLGLHGHIHESKGFTKIGRTFVCNPGSEYSEGILKGFLFTLRPKKVEHYLFTSG
ncbi:MAG: metallophosphoesterase [Candidatus Heimdallarchaeota archaeon]